MMHPVLGKKKQARIHIGSSKLAKLTKERGGISHEKEEEKTRGRSLSNKRSG